MFEKLLKLNSIIKSNIYTNYDVGKLTWFRTGGKAKIFILVENELELELLIQIER